MSDFIKSLKNKSEEEQLIKKKNRLLLEAPVPDFIPYACHYDKDTILTKNGELIQTIKIKGFSCEKLGSEQSSLREAVKKLVINKIKSNKFALYFHTIRRKTNLDSRPRFDSMFCDSLHKTWVKQNSWDSKFINELHVTIVRSAMNMKVGLSNMHKMIFMQSTIKKHEATLEKRSKELKLIVDTILSGLSSYGAERLSMVYHKDLGYCSNILKFYASIIHLEESDIVVPMSDLSQYLAKYKIAFGNNAVEVLRDSGKFFAAIISLKNHEEASIALIDKFLQMQKQFVITQTATVISTKKAINNLRRQNYILDVSKDEKYKQVSGLSKILDSVETGEGYFCHSQITIMLIEEDMASLNASIKEAFDQLSKTGISHIREDINIEDCFWSQLPGNFTNIRRKMIIRSADIGNFASLYNFPFGSLKSKWGDGNITLLRTAMGTPYFFNFHVEDNGNTIIIGDDNSGKSTLLNFLISESMKFRPKLFYMDSYLRGEVFIKAIGGTYKVFRFTKESSSIKLNPLLLEGNEENRKFLRYWFVFLLDKYSDPSDIKNYFKVIDAAIIKIFELPKEKRQLSNAASFFSDPKYSDENKKIISQLSIWIGDSKFSHIFDNDTDDLIENGSNIFGLDMTEIYDTPMSINLPVLSYLLHFFKVYFAVGNPSILSLCSGNRIFNSLYFEKNLEYILEDLKERNAVVLVSASFSSEKVNWSGVVGQVYNQKMSTKIFLVDNSSYENTSKIFKISSNELMYLQALDVKNRQFIIRQGTSSIVSQMDLYETKELRILSYSKRYSDIAKNIIQASGDDPNIWLPEFYTKV